MKKIDIFYFGDIYDVNGVNFVTNLFILSKEYFRIEGFKLNKIYSLNGECDVDKTEKLEIGRHTHKNSYFLKRRVRELLSVILSSNVSLFSWFKIKKSILIPAEQTVNRFFHESEAEIIIFQDIFTAYYFLKKGSKKKTILILHCEKDPFEQLFKYYPSIPGSNYEAFFYEAKFFVFSVITQVVFLSKRALLNNETISFKANYVYNGIEDLKQHNFPIEDGNIVNLVCVGSMNGHKGQEILIDSLTKLSDDVFQRIHLNLIGGGAQERELKQLVSSKHLSNKVTFYGIRKDVDKLLEKMDILLLPSKSEGMPLCIIEGMRQGMYILATDVGGVSEMIDEEFGTFIQRDPEDIAQKIEDIILKNKIKSAKPYARDRYLEKFQLYSMANNYSKILKGE